MLLLMKTPLIFFSALWCQKYKSSINGTVCHGECIQVKYERSLYDLCKPEIMQCMNSEYTWEFWLRNLLFWTIQPICFILSIAEKPYLWVWQLMMFSQAAFCFPYLSKSSLIKGKKACLWEDIHLQHVELECIHLLSVRNTNI